MKITTHLANNGFVRQLTSLAAGILSQTEKDTLSRLISYLLTAMQHGHSCVSLKEFCKMDMANRTTEIGVIEIMRILDQSNLSGMYILDRQSDSPINIPVKPLIVVAQINHSRKNEHDGLVYLARYFTYELHITKYLDKLNHPTNTPQKLIDQVMAGLTLHLKNGFPNQEQLSAVENSIANCLSVITGGPGTGKTTTVTLLLLLLTQLYASNDQLKISICAQTGKAAARVKDSVANSINALCKTVGLPISNTLNIIQDIEYGTIHKLLGFRSGSIYFRHNAHNKLNIDILIVDETSMISLPLFYKLLAAIDHNKIKHVIFLGDKDQLSSVEEGYVFASLIEYYTKHRKEDLFTNKVASYLHTSNRNQGHVSELAKLIIQGEAKLALAKLNDPLSKEIQVKNAVLTYIMHDLFDTNGSEAGNVSLAGYVAYIQKLNQIPADEADDYSPLAIIPELFSRYRQLSILCFANHGKFGINNLNLQIESKIKQQLQVTNIWYTGRPVIILENDYQLGLYNGDIGICVLHSGQPLISFSDGRSFIPEALPHNQVAYAITIHKSQGSEFEQVAIILSPDISGSDGRLQPYEFISRELVYTAVTRAKSQLIIYSGEKTLLHAIKTKTSRNTGLDWLLAVNSK